MMAARVFSSPNPREIMAARGPAGVGRRIGESEAESDLATSCPICRDSVADQNSCRIQADSVWTLSQCGLEVCLEHIFESKK